MDKTSRSTHEGTEKKPKKKRSQWVYVKIGTRIVDVKRVVVSNDDSSSPEGKTEAKKSKKCISSRTTEENRNKEVWKWASGGKSLSGQHTTTRTSESSTKFVYKSEPKIVHPRGRPTNKTKTNTEQNLPKIVRSSPTPSPPTRNKERAPRKNSAFQKNDIFKYQETHEINNVVGPLYCDSYPQSHPVS